MPTPTFVAKPTKPVRPIGVIAKGVEFSWGSSLPDKPSILIGGAARAADKIFGFNASWRQGTGTGVLRVRPVGVHLPPPVTAAVTAALAGPAARVWQEARRFTDHGLNSGMIPGTRLRLASLILAGERHGGYLGQSKLSASGTFAQVHGISGSFGIDSADGRISLGWLTPPAPAGPYDPLTMAATARLAKIGRGMHDQAGAKEILTAYVGPSQAATLVEALAAASPLIISFGRQVAALLPVVS